MSNILTKEDVFNKPKYRTILRLIIDYSNPKMNKKIKFAHLKYILVKNPRYADQISIEKRMEHFYSDIYTAEFKIEKLKDLEEQYKNKKLDKKSYFTVKNILTKSKIQELKDMDFFSDNDKFTSDQALRDALNRLAKLRLIKNKPDKGYNYYVPTEECITRYWRWFTHYTLDKIIPDNPTILALIQADIFRYGLLQRNSKN